MKRNRSLMKWTGSKQLMLHKLLCHLPKTGDVLVEPFAGSCSVALNTHYDKYLLNDANQDIISLYILARDEPDWLISQLRVLFNQENNTRARYIQFRRIYNECVCRRTRAVLLCFLSKHCYNGLVRYNKSGIFNVNFAGHKKPYLPEAEIRIFSQKMVNAQFYCMDFQRFIEFAAGTVGVKTQYCDPPYLPTSKGVSSFTQYTAKGFPVARHLDINNTIITTRAAFDGVYVSNHACALLDTFYPDYKKKSVFKVTRTISCKAETRVPTKEVLLYY